MSKQLKLKNVKDNAKFRLSKSKKTVWQMVGKSKGIATINSQGGSTRFVPVGTVVYSL